MKSSDVVIKSTQCDRVSNMAIAMKDVVGQMNAELKGQFGHSVIIKTGVVQISNEYLDVEFEIPFDDDLQANEAKLTFYNLAHNTINRICLKANITVAAGYKNVGEPMSIIFSGFITSKKTVYDGVDKITTVYAVDDMNRTERDVQSISYAKNTKASYMLRDLVGRVHLPVAVFKVARDHVYTDETTIDGGLMENIKRLAKVCGVSAYICKSKIYVRPLNDGDNTRFVLSADTGLLSVSEFEEEETNDGITDIVKGFEVEMLLQNRIQTASIIDLDSKEYKGRFRVREGTHSYNGSDYITKAKIIAV